jgi:uncharacterized membrane protein
MTKNELVPKDEPEVKKKHHSKSPENIEPISSTVAEVLEEIIPESGKRKEVLAVFQRFHSGPLPPPDTLAHYNKLIPHGADRIMKMAEKQSEHRINIENTVITSRELQSRRGQIFALIIAFVFSVAGCYSISRGYPWPAGIAWGATLVSLVTAFIGGKKEQRSSE